MAVLMPALSSICLSHLAIELDVMALCGFMNDMNNLVSPCRREATLFMYVWMVFTGHNTLLEGKEGKKKGSIDFPWRDCFDREFGRNDTPLWCVRILAVSRDDRSTVLEGRVTASRNTALRDSCFSDRSPD